MPRIAPLPDDELGAVAEPLAAMEAAMGFAPNSLKTLARRPDLVAGVLGFIGPIMAPGAVSADLKNMLAQIVSKSAGCTYCQAHTGHTAGGLGISPEKEAEIWNYETSDLFTDAERAALCIAQGAAQSPNAVTDEDFDELKKHFNDDQIVEIVAVIAGFGFFNRWNDTMATELESSPLQFAQVELGPKGWKVGKHG